MRRIRKETIQRQCCNVQRYLATSAFTDNDTIVNVKEVRTWSNQNDNATLARSVLKVPQYKPHLTTMERHSEGENEIITELEDYLKWRNWNQEESRSRDITNAILSHTLTFPLTLAANAQHFFHTDLNTSSNSYGMKKDSIDAAESVTQGRTRTTSSNSNGDDCKAEENENSRSMRLCCVGARAEATLPTDYWKEFLICCNYYSSYYNTTDQEEEQNIDWTIDFIGPDIPSSSSGLPATSYIHLNEDEIMMMDASSSGLPCRHHRSLTMNYHKTYLHKYILDQYQQQQQQQQQQQKHGNQNHSKEQYQNEQILNQWDGFILFNPGIGHPNLHKLWLPTLKFIFKTDRRIIMTAHSELDSCRDQDVLSDLSNFISTSSSTTTTTIVPQYNRNPFASRMEYEDPFSSSASLEKDDDVMMNK